MTETLDSILKNSILYFYGASIIFALLSYSNYFSTSLKYLPILLVYTFLNELLGLLIRNNPDFNPIISGLYASYNRVFYNVYIFIFMLYFFYIYWDFMKKESSKKVILVLSISYVFVVFITMLFQNYMIEFQLYPTLYGSLILTFCSVLYLAKQPKILRVKFAKESLVFWISIGLLVFTLTIIPIVCYYYFSDLENKKLYSTLRRLQLILINIMYSSFIYGFIQMKGKLKSGY